MKPEGGRELQEYAGKLAVRREQLLESIGENLKYWENNHIKYYLHRLSEGCQNCFGGLGMDIVLTMLCNRKCFFCPQVRGAAYRPTLTPENIQVFTPRNAVDLIKKTRTTYVSFSGGEPLVVYRELLEYVKAIKKNVPGVYQLVYTNGDSLTEARAKELGECGLNEIRFNLSAREFDLKPLAIAKKYIKRVLVATPAVPEELPKMKDALPKLAAIGVDGLNYYQLVVSTDNLEAFKKRKYTINTATLGVPESEITALELMDYSLKNKINFPIHYCNRDYKDNKSANIVNLRYRTFLLQPHESFTAGGKFKQLMIKSAPGTAGRWRGKKAGLVREEGRTLSFHPSLFSEIHKTIKPREIIVQYFDARVYNTKKQGAREITINKDYHIFGVKKAAGAIRLKGGDVALYERLFINKEPVRELVKKSLGLPDGPGKILEFYRRFANLEYFGWPVEL